MRYYKMQRTNANELFFFSHYGIYNLWNESLIIHDVDNRFYVLKFSDEYFRFSCKSSIPWFRRIFLSLPKIDSYKLLCDWGKELTLRGWFDWDL